MKNTKMTKITALALAAALCFALCGCGGQSGAEPTPEAVKTSAPEQEAAPAPEPAEKQTLIVFAAASLTETLTEIGDRYMSEHDGTEIIFTFDSSGTLQTQIEEGAECDLFISAAQKQMDALDEGGLILDSSRIDLLENKVALVVPEGNPAGIESYADLAERLESGNVMLAMGNADVPVGQYTGLIFEHFGLSEDSLAQSGCLTYGSNVKEVVTQVSEGAVDCGIVYSTDAVSGGLDIVDVATEDMCGRVVYPAAVLAQSANPDAAQAFLDCLSEPDSEQVFNSVGFSLIK